jgi:hypothetical protein
MRKIYLAIPYTRMESSSFEQANIATIELLKLGVNVFSPITHSHPLVILDGESLKGTWEFWEQMDKQFIDWADEVIVLIPKEGFQMVINSKGIKNEIDYARSQEKTIRYATINELKNYKNGF